MNPDQLEKALEPLRVVDAKTLDDIAKTFKKSRDKRKRAVGVFLTRINQYRLGSSAEMPGSPGGGSTPHAPSSGLTDLPE